MQNTPILADAALARFIPLLGPITLSALTPADEPRAQPWADAFVLARERVGAAERGRLYRAVASGAMFQIRRGVFVPTDTWNAADGDDRYLMRIRAAAVLAPEPLVFASGSAAALWRLPMCGEWPTVPVIVCGKATGGRSATSLVRRCDGIPNELWMVDGLIVTSLVRTAVDIARFAPADVALAMVDRALATKARTVRGALAMTADTAALLTELAGLGAVRGHARARATIDFADGASGSVGESISRLSIHLLGFVAPVLQYEFRDAQGRMRPDFWWPDYNLVGEFDGRGKYLREVYVAGRSTAEVVLDEKAREDRLRRLGPTVVRWGWAEARSAPALRRVLLAAGLGYRKNASRGRPGQ